LDKRLKIAFLLVSLLTIVTLPLFNGCGEQKAVTESQIADYNKPGVVYLVTTWAADVDIPVLDIDTNGLGSWLAGEVFAG